MARLNFIILKTKNMRVRTHDGKEGTVIQNKGAVCEVRYNNGKTNWYRKNQLTELTTGTTTGTKPPSRAHDHLLLTIQTIEGMHKTASEARTDCAQCAEMAYRLVLDMLNDLK